MADGKKRKTWNVTVVTVEEFNEKIKEIKKIRKIVNDDAETRYNTPYWDGFKMRAYVWEERSTIRLSYLDSLGKNINLKTYLDGTDKEHITKEVSGGTAYSLLQRMSSPKLPDQFVFSKSAMKSMDVPPLLWYNKKYSVNEWIKAWSYDLNSAYAAVMANEKFPDLSNPIINKSVTVVPEGMIGVNPSSEEVFVQPGNVALVMFNLIDSPYKKFAEYYFNKKNQFKAEGNKTESAYCKNVLNLSVGNMKHHRPLHRLWIIYCCNEFMKKIIAQHPDNILHCNTDCVVSNIPLELPVSTKLGEFKLEHDGENFRYFETSYQWEGKIPSKKGVPRGWWRDGDSLLGTGSGYNKYYFDWETKELIENEETDE